MARASSRSRKTARSPRTSPPARGADNLAKASTWTGTVVRKGNRVIFQSSQGPWLTLVHRGDTLYGVANDPASDANIMISLEREGRRGAAYAK
jgi:hypothetical protein